MPRHLACMQVLIDCVGVALVCSAALSRAFFAFAVSTSRINSSPKCRRPWVLSLTGSKPSASRRALSTAWTWIPPTTMSSPRARYEHVCAFLGAEQQVRGEQSSPGHSGFPRLRQKIKRKGWRCGQELGRSCPASGYVVWHGRTYTRSNSKVGLVGVVGQPVTKII